MTASSTPVLILNWNGWDDTFACLQSLQQRQDAGENLVVWLVDNGSQSDQSDHAATIFAGLRIVKLGENFGWAGGYNRALRMARDEGFEFAYLLNNDCRVRSDFLEVALNEARKDTQIAAIGSRILFEIPSGFVKFDGEYHQPREKAWVEQFGARRVRDVNGAGMLIRLEAWAEGGFDERFFCYAEETEWCRRMGTRGWTIMLCPDSLIEHRGEGSDVGSNALYYRVRNQFLLLQCEAPGLAARLKAQIILVLRWTYHALKRRSEPAKTRAILAGLRDGLRGKWGKRLT